MQDLYLPLAVGAAFVGLAGVFDNHLWRIVCCYLWHVLSSYVIGSSSLLTTAVYLATLAAIWWVPMWANLSYMPRRGCVFVTGCDSGMGQATVVYLAQSNDGKEGYDQIFAACFNPKAAQEYYDKTLTLEQNKYVTVVPLDVSDQGSVDRATKLVQGYLDERKEKGQASIGLTGLCMYHGIAFNGPSPYMPVEMYERTMQVNFVGYVRITQALLPLLKARTDQQVPGRLIYTGTGGGPTTPCPPFLTAYMSSKFATEAYVASLRQELYMTETNMEAVVINPGFVKPTMLMEEGEKLSQKMWQACEDKLGSTKAKDEFGPMLDHFMQYSALQPGTHVSEVCKVAEHALLANVPRTSYKVGIDSKVAPIVGMMPAGMRELIARHGIYGVLSPAGTVKGYKL